MGVYNKLCIEAIPGDIRLAIIFYSSINQSAVCMGCGGGVGCGEGGYLYEGASWGSLPVTANCQIMLSQLDSRRFLQRRRLLSESVSGLLDVAAVAT